MVAAAIAAVVLFAIAAFLGWIDARHQARASRLDAQLRAQVIARGR
jgi:hypothetical protein